MGRVAVICALAFGAWQPANSAIITQWTFEEIGSVADTTNSTTTNGIIATIGAGFASGFHASNATDWTTPVGNGSASSLSVNTWTNGDYFQFRTASTGYTNLSLQWDQIRSTTGPATFDLRYSTDGVSYVTALNNYTVGTNSGLYTWSSGTTNVTSYAVSRFTLDLAAITALNDSTNIYFRLVNDTTSAPVGGTVRVDNFTLFGTEIAVVPEPSAAVAALAAAGIGLRRRRRRR